MELSKKQKEIVEATEPYVVVHACPAAGKTQTLAARVKYLLSKGYDPRRIVVITFTNAAAETMYDRIGKTPGLSCCTIHSYANKLLTAYNINTKTYIAEENFDKLFELIKLNPFVIEDVDYLLLDESQDTSDSQFEFIFDMIKPKEWMIFGDIRQTIFRWSGANPDNIINLMNDPKVKTYELNENYRNGGDILQFAKSIIRQAGIKYSDNSIPMRKTSGKVINVTFAPDEIARTIKQYGNYKDWFILARTNNEVDIMQKALSNFGVKNMTFKKAQLKSGDIRKKLEDDSVKVLTIHTAKGMEARNVVVVGARFYNLEERCTSYVAATRAKDLLVWTVPNRSRKKKTTNWE